EKREFEFDPCSSGSSEKSPSRRTILGMLSAAGAGMALSPLSFPQRVGVGLWGAIPFPDTDGSLREIEYIYDTLKLDGIGLLTSYDDGKLLGHPNFAPVLEELNRRKAVIFVHPTISCCGMPIRHVNRVQIDFPTDTTRTITDLIYSGSLIRFPNIRWIFSHGGGTVLMLTPRLAGGNLTPEERAGT